MSATQLLAHSFITASIPSRNDGALSPVDQPEHEEPVPDFSFFSGVAGKSRMKCEFEELQFLGKRGFGTVMKV